jgi:hypothetical protein
MLTNGIFIRTTTMQVFVFPTRKWPQKNAYSRGFVRAESAESAEKYLEISEVYLSLRPLRLCAEQFLPAGFWLRLRRAGFICVHPWFAFPELLDLRSNP